MTRSRNRAVQRTDTEETRRAILGAARDLFLELGYRAVTTRMVAEASGVKQPLLYYHFADKEALYLEVQREQSMVYRAALERIAARHHESVAERLRQIVRYLSHFHHQNMGMFFHELKYEMSPKAQIAMREFFLTSIVVPITSIFEDGIRTGFLRSPVEGGVPSRIATYLLLNTLSSVEVRSDMPDDEASLLCGKEDTVDLIVHVLIYGMAAQPPVAFPGEA